MADVPEVLFVCRHNAGRRVRVTSAGSQPAEELNPAGLTIEQVRPVRDEIAARVRALLDDLL